MRGIGIRALPAIAAAALLVAAVGLGRAGAQEQAPAADWRPEFEAVCVKTDIAMNLSSEELADLIARCDRLAERIGSETEIVRKVYLRRLKSCRALFAYVLETRAAAAPGSAPAPGTAVPAPPADSPAVSTPPPAVVETPATPGTQTPEPKPAP